MHRVVLAACVVLSACRVDDPFICESDAECRRAGSTGTCEASNYCSFPDIDCASGRRYDALAKLSGRCVLDDDDDTIADDGDNCVGVANTDQYDEDNDNLGDTCDPCPPFADNRDDDDDGVGNLCDPKPTTPGDRITLFTGFHEPLSMMWSVTGPAIIENDGLTLQAGTKVVPPPTVGVNATLIAGVTLLGTATEGAYLGLPYSTAGGGVLCVLQPAAIGLYSVATGRTLVAMMPFTAKPSTEYVFGMRRTSSSYTCTVRSAPDAQPVEVIGDASSAETTVQIGGDSTARFGWLMLLE